MKAAKQIRAYLDAMNRAGVVSQKCCGWEGTAVTRQDLEQVLARLDGYKDLRRQVQKTQTMRTELAAALGFQVPTPFIPRWRGLLAAARDMQKALAEERAERERLASQLREAEKESEERLKDAEFTEGQYNTLSRALREVCDAVLPAYAAKDARQQLAALQQQIVRERDAVASAREQRTEANDELHTVKGINRGMTTALDETYTAIRTLYAELGGSPGILPINDGPGMINYLTGRIKQREQDAAEPAIAARVNQALTGVQSKLRDTLAERDQAQEKLAQIARIATPEDLPF